MLNSYCCCNCYCCWFVTASGGNQASIAMKEKRVPQQWLSCICNECTAFFCAFASNTILFGDFKFSSSITLFTNNKNNNNCNAMKSINSKIRKLYVHNSCQIFFLFVRAGAHKQAPFYEFLRSFWISFSRQQHCSECCKKHGSLSCGQLTFLLNY